MKICSSPLPLSIGGDTCTCARASQAAISSHRQLFTFAAVHTRYNASHHVQLQAITDSVWDSIAPAIAGHFTNSRNRNWLKSVQASIGVPCMLQALHTGTCWKSSMLLHPSARSAPASRMSSNLISNHGVRLATATVKPPAWSDCSTV
jgi:hypothetical protein